MAMIRWYQSGTTSILLLTSMFHDPVDGSDPDRRRHSYHDQVIIWLNGTFGCGKTSTAAKLHSLVPSSRVFDPETAGYMLQPNLADHPASDFQHWPPWRPLVVATATELTRFTGQHLIAPQTILVRAYREQIFAGLRDAGLDVFHIVLDADDEVLRQRIQGSAEAQAWRLDHLAEYRSSRAWMIQAADLAVDTGRRTPAEIAHQIAVALPESIRTDTL
jgi:hypothetical protein